MVKVSIASLGSIGIFKERPRSLTVPNGKKPNFGRYSCSANPLIASLTVPSPPIAKTLSTFSSAALRANFVASPSFSVSCTSTSSKNCSNFSRACPAYFFASSFPELGLTIKTAFFIITRSPFHLSGK